VDDATWTRRVAELVPAWTAPAVKERIRAALAPKR